MNASVLSSAAGQPRHRTRRAGRSRPAARVSLRPATSADVSQLHALITAHAEEGHLLPRAIDELATHAARFVVAVDRGRVVGCAELAPLSARVGEIRSLVVESRARGRGVGRDLVGEIRQRAGRDGFETLCAFTHDAAYFVRMGFSIVPHSWVPEKIAVDCRSCALFRRCGQYAVVLPLQASSAHHAAGLAPLAALRG